MITAKTHTSVILPQQELSRLEAPIKMAIVELRIYLPIERTRRTRLSMLQTWLDKHVKITNAVLESLLCVVHPRSLKHQDHRHITLVTLSPKRSVMLTL